MITRDNYQEFFLLYVDNELSATERQAVESWVTANPDLQEEWETLLLCRVHPEERLIFPDKSILLRQTDGVIGERNYMDYFLSYIDGELDDKNRDRMELFLQTHPSKQIQLEQLRLTVSIPDKTIVFPGKESLYYNEKRRPVILFYRWAAGAAAVLAGAVVLLLLHGRQTGQPAIAVQKPPVTATPNTAIAADIKKDSATVTPATTAALYPTEGRKQKTNNSKAIVIPASPEKDEHRQQVMVPEKVEKELASRPVIDRMEPVDNSADRLVAVGEKDPAAGVKTTGLAIAARQVNIPKEQSSFATQALLQEDNEKDIAVAASEPASPGKSKLRGLFRKVARTFGKTADRDGEGKREVLISAFQVEVN